MSLLVRAASLTNYSEVARAGGLDPARMLLDAGLSPSVLREPDLMIPVERVGQLLQASAAMSGNESFGLCMAESRLLSNLGAVGMLIRDQPTLRDSLDVLMRYQVLLNGSLSLMIEECADVVVIREEVKAGNPQQSTRQRIELALGVMLRLDAPVPRGRLAAATRVLRAPGAARPQCASALVWPLRRVRLRLQLHRLREDRSRCAQPVRRSGDGALRAAVAGRVGQAAAGPTMLEDVRRTILLLLPSGRCTIEQVAEHLGVACRTVQRGLAEQGQSFSSMVNEIRKELATRHVIESDRPLTEVAMLLGFSAPSAFSRWYHAQFGCSAKESRAARGTVRRPAA